MGISSSWDGTFTSSDFFLSAKALSGKWKTTNPAFPPWTWVPSPRSLGAAPSEVQGYLSLEKFCLHRNNKENRDDDSYYEKGDPIDKAALVYLILVIGEVIKFNSACQVHSYEQEINFYDFHIVYSNSYRVPVLYFCGYHCDGQPLTLENIEIDLPTNSLEILRESKWTFMTQEEHPILNRPWYTLHPCGTSEWMKLLFYAVSSQANREGVRIEQQYLISWLSVVGQAVGLRVPLEMLPSMTNVLT
ncbi:hypothetical protein GIB67_031798 [Kingdonia uniflora]|uniref:Ubiquitin-like-conjugating enzyme ATG10 n=1 Tax=Kingdonia uniflora TaxID=39325 RepID=A0A7J7L4L5_9MAGN|nr:hypothetical protein GIB67_031798 [Kingdonia uniflora]